MIVLIGGGAGFYFKVYRKRKDANIRDEYEPENEYEADGPDDYAGDEYDTEPDGGRLPEDDSTPWEDESGDGEE